MPLIRLHRNTTNRPQILHTVCGTMPTFAKPTRVPEVVSIRRHHGSDDVRTRTVIFNFKETRATTLPGFVDPHNESRSCGKKHVNNKTPGFINPVSSSNVQNNGCAFICTQRLCKIAQRLLIQKTVTMPRIITVEEKKQPLRGETSSEQNRY